jgi:uncharacterized protein YbjT (DUF2867 family)
MRVLVTGAYGLIGSACLAQLHQQGHELVALGRAVASARRRFPYARWIAADARALTAPAVWRGHLGSIDAVVNCLGVLQDGARDDVRGVQVAATRALFDTCRAAGIRRVIHVSMIGAEQAAPTEFARSKVEADDYLAGLDLDWLILRPALVLSPAAYGGTAMLRAIAACPLVTPVVAAGARIQVVSVADVARTVALALKPGAPARAVWQLAHPQVHRLEDIVLAMRDWLGGPARPLWHVPDGIARAVAACADALSWLGWRSPARSTALKQLTVGVVGDPAAWTAATGIAPQSLPEIFAERPANVQDRWHARLFLIKPLAIAALALFWIATGLVTIGPGYGVAAAQLAASGFPAALVAPAVLWGGVFDVVLGLMLPVRRLTRPVLLAMLVITPFYLLIGTLLAPHLWLDPLGPLLKIVPVLLATAFTLAIVDER